LAEGRSGVTEYNPREYWSRVADQVRERDRSGELMAGDDTPFYRYKRATFSRRLLARVPVENATVLEVGCGPGGNLLELSARGPRRLVGCDISPSMLELAASRTAGLAGLELVETNGAELPFADREFDVSLTVTVLHHNLDDLAEVLLQEICRVTRRQIYLFEHTAHTRGESLAYVERPVADYQRICAAYGFSLSAQAPLGVAVSEELATRMRRYLNPRGRREGDPVTRLNTVAETAALPLTRVLDKAIGQRRGLTLMVFQPESPA
jgi:SAM-dependent methyltransferase